MKEYNSNYLGIVIDNNDPEYRGRVQVFIPHIMPALYENWNEEGKDITITCVGDNLQNAMDTKIITRLKKILPWAEAASPIIGSSAPGGVVRGAGGSTQFVQTPTSQPTQNAAPGDGSLANVAQNMIGFPTSDGPGGGNKACAYAFSKMFNNAYPGQAIYVTKEGKPVTMEVSAGTLYDQMKTNPSLWQEIPPGQQQPGDAIVTASRTKSGHIGIFRTPERITSNSSSSARVEDNYNYNRWKESISTRVGVGPTGIFRYIGPGSTSKSSTTSSTTSPSTGQQPAASGEQQNPSAYPPLPCPVTSPNGIPQTITASSDPTAGQPGGTMSGGGTVSGIKQINPVLTSYSPQGAGSEIIKMEGGYASSRPGPDGQAVVRSLEDFSTGKSKYVTLAGDSSTYGKTYVIPEITWKDRAGNTVVSKNVPAYVHDTGSAFEGKGETRFDVPIFNDGTNAQMNTQPFGMKSLSFTEVDKATFESTSGQSVITQIGAEGAPSIVGNTYGYGRPSQYNTNDSACGLFAFPNVGAMVWVFFREGNPLYPVYFAASYSSTEWQSAYGGGSSNATGTNTGNPKEGVVANGSRIHLQGGCGLQSDWYEDTTDPLKSFLRFSINGGDGSGVHFRPGIMEEYAKNDKASFVDGNIWNVTHGTKETWIGSNSNMNCIGNCVEFFGKWDQESMDAAKELADISYNITSKVKATA